MPLAVVCVILMQLLPSEVRPLVPALQSTWLHVHVTLAMLSYAACAVSFALAMMFLIKDHFPTETFLALTSALVGAIYIAIIATRFEKWGGLSVTAWDAKEKSDMFLGRGMRLFVTVPDLGWLFVMAGLAAVVPLVFYFLARVQKNEAYLDIANKSIFVGVLLQVDRAGGIRSSCPRCQLSFAVPGRPLPHGAGGLAVYSRRTRDRRLRFLALPDVALEAHRSGSPAS